MSVSTGADGATPAQTLRYSTARVTGGRIQYEQVAFDEYQQGDAAELQPGALFYGAPARESAFLVAACKSGHVIRGWDFDNAGCATDPLVNCRPRTIRTTTGTGSSPRTPRTDRRPFGATRPEPAARPAAGLNAKQARALPPRRGEHGPSPIGWTSDVPPKNTGPPADEPLHPVRPALKTSAPAETTGIDASRSAARPTAFRPALPGVRSQYRSTRSMSTAAIITTTGVASANHMPLWYPAGPKSNRPFPGRVVPAAP
ncbi:hypothetical protein [Amycolatopsis benzoatilytica]|uniref:hypothetical protein n=1 Tax=Amycolatopsis benzoatilytica TaxID=346045 RepID=UPI001B7F80B2|nr:hypothetical protein [Amycolatopsis benzoatilytica]